MLWTRLNCNACNFIIKNTQRYNNANTHTHTHTYTHVCVCVYIYTYNVLALGSLSMPIENI